MAKIRKSVKAKEKTFESKNFREKRHHKKSKHQNCSSSECHSDSEDVADDGEDRKNTRKSSKSYEHSNKLSPSSVRELKDRNIQKKRNIEQDIMYKDQPAHALLDSTIDNDEIREGSKRHHDKAKCDRYYLEGWMDSESGRKWRENRHAGSRDSDDMAPRRESHQKHDYKPFKLSEEERAARLQEMQMDAELHEEQRWKRLKKDDENDT